MGAGLDKFRSIGGEVSPVSIRETSHQLLAGSLLLQPESPTVAPDDAGAATRAKSTLAALVVENERRARESAQDDLLSPVKAKPQSYLERGVDLVAGRLFTNDETRRTVDRYGAEIIKTAAMFAPRRLGFRGVAVTYALDQANPESTLGEQLADASLGALKGLAVKGIYHIGSTSTRFAPTKGVMMGIGSRAADDVLQRDTFEKPAAAIQRLSSDVANPSQILLDAAVWTIGEGTFGAMNAASKGALVKNHVAGGIAIGASFGVLNGAGSELIRQEKAHESFGLGGIVKEGLINGAITAVGAGLGIKGGERYYRFRDANASQGMAKLDRQIEDPGAPTSVRHDPSKPREFVITQGKAELEAFRQNKTDFAMISGHEVPLVMNVPVAVDVPISWEENTLAWREEPSYSLRVSIGEVQPAKGENATRTIDKSVDRAATGMPEQAQDQQAEVSKVVPAQLSTDEGPSKWFGGIRSSLVKAEFDWRASRPDETKIYFQRLNANESTLLPAADLADLIVTCYPENLAPALRQRHAFADGQGKVWMLTDQKDRLLLTNNFKPREFKTWTKEGFTDPVRLDQGRTPLDLMAPLVVGDPRDMNSEKSLAAWSDFDRQMQDAKKIGATAISTDVWWGLIEPKQGQFDFSYVDKLVEHIEKAGLKWNPILSFHECGGNVGDTVHIPLPDWVWQELAKKMPGGDAAAAKYRSEQGNVSNEYISLWADEHAIPMYSSAMKAFQDHYANKRDTINEINISLGPAGELRYPSYNSHDKGTDFPTRGALQSFSEPAQESFRNSVLTKYGGLVNLAKAWGIANPDPNDAWRPDNQTAEIVKPGESSDSDAKHFTRDQILPPGDVKGFFDRNDHMNTQYGKDFFDWYNQSLIDHGMRVMTEAENRFSQKGAAFAGKDLGAKVPGVHWLVGTKEGDKVIPGNRLAELSAGLIRTSRGDLDSDSEGHGYRPILSMFNELQGKNNSDAVICPSFTCMELPDGDGGVKAQALPYTLANWVGREAEHQGLWLRGENALNFTLAQPEAWDRIKSHLNLPGSPGYYHGATFLRLGDVVDNADARAKFSEIVNNVRSITQPVSPVSTVKPSWWRHFLRLKRFDAA